MLATSPPAWEGTFQRGAAPAERELQGQLGNNCVRPGGGGQGRASQPLQPGLGQTDGEPGFKHTVCTANTLTFAHSHSHAQTHFCTHNPHLHSHVTHIHMLMLMYVLSPHTPAHTHMQWHTCKHTNAFSGLTHKRELTLTPPHFTTGPPVSRVLKAQSHTTGTQESRVRSKAAGSPPFGVITPSYIKKSQVRRGGTRL